MKIKPVGTWLLLKETLDGEKQFRGEYLIQLADNVQTVVSLVLAEILEVGPEATEDYKIGDFVIFKTDSPAKINLKKGADNLTLLPAAHIVAKAALEVAEA